MENENSSSNANDKAKDVTIVDSTTEKPEEVTKRSIRVQTWKKIQDGCSPYPRYVFNRISYFTGAEKAASLLVDTEEFKAATSIKVNGDRPQDPVKLVVVENKKKLFVPAGRQSSAVFVQINVPEDADDKEQKRAVRVNSIKEFGTDIGVDTDVKLDLLIIGSCAVSKKGHRIGRGNGYVDLDFAILKELGIVTPDTLIVTTVHDCQVYDDLPIDLFTNYDMPVDMIVTPTEVIRVEKKLPRPDGIIWHLLSERRLGIVPVLKEIKENAEKDGKVIVLKSEDTDVETNRRVRSKRRSFFTRKRRFRRNENNVAADTDGEQNNQQNNKDRPRRMKRMRRPRRDMQSEGDNTDKENTNNSNQMRRRRDNRDFCIKVSNIDRSSRIKDLKAELRKRGCNPMFISWKGAYGKCYLHFGKRGGQDSDAAMNEMLKLLDDLKLSVPKGEATRDVILKVELIKRQTENRIETTDVTSV